MCWNHKQTNVMQFYDKFFHKNIASGPEYACSCCDQLWYNFGSDSNLKQGKFPSCSTANNSGFPYKPDHLVYPSCKSLELPRGGQLSIHENIVNNYIKWCKFNFIVSQGQ